MALIIKVLLENRLGKGQDSLLQAKPGLSLLVEDETSRVLFDTGPDGTFLHNAQRMGVSLSDLTATVLSHGHYDHCGGVPWLPTSRIDQYRSPLPEDHRHPAGIRHHRRSSSAQRAAVGNSSA